MGYLMLTNAIIYSLYAIATNVVQQNLNNVNDVLTCLSNGSCSIVVLMGLSSKVSTTTPPATLIVQAWITVVVVLVWIGQLIYCRKKFDAVTESVDSRLVSPSDFTALLYGLPQ